MTPPPDDDTHERLGVQLRIDADNALRLMPQNVTHRVHLELGVGHVDEQLMALGLAEHADVMVLGTHRYRLLARLTSVSHRVLDNAPMSIACVPEVLGTLEAPARPSQRQVSQPVAMQ